MDAPLELLFAVAADIEGAALRARLDAEPGRTGVDLATLGVGDESTDRLRAMLRERQPRAMISPGLAGALDPALQAGDVVLVRAWVDPEPPHARCASASPRLLERTRAALNAVGIASRTADAVTVDAPLHDSERRQALHRDAGASVVEMEGSRWAKRAAAAGTEFVSVRVISDDAATPLPRPRHLLLERSGRIRWNRWLRALAQDGRSPQAEEELRRLFRARREWLAAMHALDAVGSALLGDLDI